MEEFTEKFIFLASSKSSKSSGHTIYIPKFRNLNRAMSSQAISGTLFLSPLSLIRLLPGP